MDEREMAKSIVADDDDKGRIRWFSEGGCVVEKNGRYEVHVGRLIVGVWDKDDVSLRNALVVTFAQQPDIHLGKLAKAFRLALERLRQLRLAYEQGGLRAITTPGRIGRAPKLTAKIRAKIEKMFADGLSIDEVHKKMRRFGRSTIGHAHTAWRKRKDAEVATEAAAESEPTQATLPGVKCVATRPRDPEPIVSEPLEGVRETSGGFVQHAGSWLMLGMLEARGLYEVAA